MFEGHHYQNAYVTSDIDRAVDEFSRRADVRLQIRHDVPLELKRPNGTAQLQMKLALLWVGDLQYEFIQPIEDPTGIYADAVSGTDLLRFHHVAMRVDNWDDFRARIAGQSFPLMFEGESGPLKFLYLDGRETVGHYLEYTWMPQEMWLASGGR